MTDDARDQLARLELALVSAALLINKRYKLKTALVRPPDALDDIVQICEVIAELASPPLRINLARDLAAAGFKPDELRPLLVSTLPSDIEATDEALAAEYDRFRELGSTVSWPGFPPGQSPKPPASDAHREQRPGDNS